MFQEQKYKGKYKLKSFEEYGRVVWGCDKCGQKFTGYKYLKIHKKEVHAY